MTSRTQRTHAQALFNYNAIEADELSLLRGETMVVYGSPEEAWYECELHGQVSAYSSASVTGARLAREKLSHSGRKCTLLAR